MFLILAQVDNGRGIVIWGINAYLDENNGEVNMIEFYEEILFAFGHHQPIILNPVRNKYWKKLIDNEISEIMKPSNAKSIHNYLFSKICMETTIGNL